MRLSAPSADRHVELTEETLALMSQSSPSNICIALDGAAMPSAAWSGDLKLEPWAARDTVSLRNDCLVQLDMIGFWSLVLKPPRDPPHAQRNNVNMRSAFSGGAN